MAARPAPGGNPHAETRKILLGRHSVTDETRKMPKAVAAVGTYLCALYSLSDKKQHIP